MEIAGLVQDRRRLAAQFQRDRRQVPGRRLCDQAANRSRAREHEMIERQFDESPGNIGITGDDRHLLLGEGSRDALLQQRRERRRQLGRLDHHAIARRDGADGRPHRELIRIVPRGYHADHAQRLAQDAAVAGPVMQGGGRAPRLHPRPQVAHGVPGGGRHHHQVGQPCLVRRAVAEIARDRLDQRGPVALGHVEQAAQAVGTHRLRRHHVADIRLLLRGQDARHVRRAVEGIVQHGQRA
ncbi:hypothetical protein D3C81_972800 [compost metagenome]